MKKEHGLRISEQDYEKCRSAVMADHPKEKAAFLLAGRKTIGSIEELIVRRVIEIPKSEYRIQEHYHLDISPKAINGLISLCEQNRLGVILCHSHPTDTPYSPSDNAGEKRIAETLWKFLPDAPVGSLLISPNRLWARVWKSSEGSFPAATVTVIGRCIRKIDCHDNVGMTDVYNKDIYDRQVLAFGAGGQEILSKAKIGIVGVGGTGSPTAEQIVRMGVRDIVLIDPDTFDSSNITRIYGSSYEDLQGRWARFLPWMKRKKAKVEIILRHLKSINPDVQITAIKDSVVKATVARSLLDRDIIFCCTDEHWGRSVINQISYQYLIPTINMGVRIDSRDGRIRGASGSVHILRPEEPCLWCYQFLSSDRIMAESLPAHERKALLREGYVEDIDTATPSVIPLTTTISGHSVTSFLQLMTDFMGKAGDISCLNHYIMEGVVERGRSTIADNCICKSVKGYGDMKHIPTLT